MFESRPVPGPLNCTNRPHARPGRLKLDELQTRFRPVDEINEAFQDMLSGTVARTIIRP